MKGRRRARRLALQVLYELDLSDHPLSDVLFFRIHDDLLPAVSRSRLAGADPGEVARTLTRWVVDEAAEGEAPEEITADIRQQLAGRIRHAAFAVDIVEGVTASHDALDGVIAQLAPEWPVDQMAPIDRNLMRIALWEIATGITPERVAISEAVELAREFSGEGSRRLVNGALGTYSADRHAIEATGDAG